MTGDMMAAGAPAMGAMPAIAGDRHEDGHADGGACLNCGTQRIGDYCHHCGQSAHVHRSLGAIGHELAHGVFHFEGKIWRTLPMLLFRPGELTRRYAQGERARFVSPLAMFLFIIFVLFAMLSVIGAHLEVSETYSDKEISARTQIAASIAKNGEKTARLTSARTRTADAAERERINEQLSDIQKQTTVMKGTLAVMEPESIDGLKKVHTGWQRLDKGLHKAAENPNLVLYKLQSNAYKFAWVLIPVSLPFMWLLFPFNRRFTVYDHAVFVTYSLCFVSLFGVGISLLSKTVIGVGPLFAIASIAIPIHMYKQLRGAYGIGRIGALLRMILMFIAANMALIAFAALLMGLGLVG